MSLSSWWMQRAPAGGTLPTSTPAGALVALNLTRNTTLAERLELAGESGNRQKGLLGRKGLAQSEGLWIKPCEAVHTFGMRFSIDLVYLDRRYRVRKVCRNVPPWRLSACVTAHSILELPVGAIDSSQTRPGDEIRISSGA